MSDPLVSIVIPTRDRPHLLQRAVRSALGQDGVELEVVVVDDGSDEPAASVLPRRPDLRVVRQESRRGVARARNRGLAEANGRWIALLDDDDLWSPHKLEAQLAAMAVEGTDWSCAGAVVVDEDLGLVRAYGPPDRELVAEEILLANVVPAGASNVVARRDVLRELGGFDESLDHFADWDMWTRLAQGHVLTTVDRPLVAYMRHQASMSYNMPTGFEEFEHVVAKHAALRDARRLTLDLPAHLDGLARVHLRGGHRRLAFDVYRTLIRAHPHPRWLARAAVGLTWPPAVRLPDVKRRREIASAWRAEAEDWLQRAR